MRVLGMDDPVVPERRGLVEARPQGENDVGAVQGLRRLAGAAAPRRTDVEMMAVGHGVGVSVRRDERHVQKLGQRDRLLAGLGVDDAPARQEERPLRLRQHGHRALDGLRIARRARIHRPVGVRREHFRVDGLAVQKIPRNVQEHRPALVGERGPEGVVQHLGDALGLVDLQRELGDGLEHRHQVERLAAIAIDEVARDVAGDHQDRRPALVGQGDAGDEIGRARPGGGDAGGRLPRGAGIAVRHEGGPLLVPGVDEADIASAVHLGDDAVGGRPHHAEGVLDPFRAQCLDDRLASFHLSCPQLRDGADRGAVGTGDRQGDRREYHPGIEAEWFPAPPATTFAPSPCSVRAASASFSDRGAT